MHFDIFGNLSHVAILLHDIVYSLVKIKRVSTDAFFSVSAYFSFDHVNEIIDLHVVICTWYFRRYQSLLVLSADLNEVNKCPLICKDEIMENAKALSTVSQDNIANQTG